MYARPIATPASSTVTHLSRLGRLLKERNQVDKEIASIIGRPAHSGHIGDFVAATIFDIELIESASHEAIDGHFTRGPLAGKSVNIKKYSIDQSVLDMKPDSPPNFYLVLAGPRTPPQSSRGTTHPWVIESVFLFDGLALLRQLNEYGVKIGVATSVRRHLWDGAEIYPRPTNRTFQLTPAQRSMIRLFSG